MKKAEAEKMYHSITNIKDEFIEEALAVGHKRRQRGWVKWGGIAAAAVFCLTIGTFLWRWPKGALTEVKALESLDEIAASYNGSLLTEKLSASGVKTNGILLSYAKGGDVSDPDTWDCLSITGDYDGQDFTLNCDFDGTEEKGNPEGAYATALYGDVEVTIYREEEPSWGEPYIYLYQAEFTLEGVAYSLSFHSDDSEKIYRYLDMVLGDPEEDETSADIILNGVLGFDMCRVVVEEVTPWTIIWHYYVEVDGEDICVAEQSGYSGDPETWSRDLDGDGVPELICNCTSGDGVQSVDVFRNNNGVIEKGWIRLSYYEEKYGWTHINMGGISSLPAERYDPERDVFTATDYYTNGHDNPITVEFNDGLEPFDFLPFEPSH